MAITWTKDWSASDDGTVLKGVDLKNIQDDINSQGVSDAESIHGFPIDVPTIVDDGKALTFDDANSKFIYEDPSGLPVGLMTIFAGAAAPSGGWALCDGSALSRATFDALFAEIGVTFGVGDGSTTFNLPDLRGRFALGADNMGGTPANRVTASEADTVGDSSGDEAKDISHTHNVPAQSDTGWGSDGSIDPGSLAAGFAAASDEAAASALNDRPTGSGGSATQDVMNPYLTLNYIIKTT